MVNIGEFARYAGVSVRMLRHYDRLGLLEPVWVDPVTGYRHYSANQLPRLNRLLALKDLGFTLEQTGPILDAEVGADELRGMLILRRAQVAEQLQADQARLDAIERRLRMIESEGHMSDLEFVDKPLDAAHVAQLTTVVADTTEISQWMGPAYERLSETLAASGAPPRMPAISWYESDGAGLRIGAAFPTALDSPPKDGVEIADLPAVPKAVTVIHRGSMETIGDSWQALARHVDDRGLQPVGVCREVYLETPMDDPSAWVTELQQPVA
jgi:DNA-binding transcriptional MerR regulator